MSEFFQKTVYEDFYGEKFSFQEILDNYDEKIREGCDVVMHFNYDQEGSIKIVFSPTEEFEGTLTFREIKPRTD